MGLTAKSTGLHALDSDISIDGGRDDFVIALAGNPNVGKSTVFNALTGMNQHTGNWPGKTVASAQGRYQHRGRGYTLVDLPGTYSLMAHSAEEEVARDFICFGKADAVIVVCDATCLERNLNLVLQTIEITSRTVVCINLLDEAEKKQIHVDLSALEQKLGVPVVGTAARTGRGLDQLKERVATIVEAESIQTPFRPRYPAVVDAAAEVVEPVLSASQRTQTNPRFLALHLLDDDASFHHTISQHLGIHLEDEPLASAILQGLALLNEQGIPRALLKDKVTACVVMAAEEIAAAAVTLGDSKKRERDRKLDRLLTSRLTGIPMMLLLLGGVFWLTIVGANYPSQMLSSALFWIQARLTDFVRWIGAPEWVNGLFVEGMYRTLAWVVSVMLPPMAIFFPIFTLLEDFGYLPRIAFNLDHAFQKARACGKQALTMCME